MRAKDKLLFSPKYTFAKLLDIFGNEDKLVDAFKDRVYGFYLKAAKLLNDKEFGFGCGLLVAATIDFLARIDFPEYDTGDRIEKWLKNNIYEFRNEDFARRFYEDFRCGLVHEGRIKNPGEFSYESEEIISTEEEIIRIHPGILLKRVEEAFEKYLVTLKEDSDAFSKFKDALSRDFAEEIGRDAR